MGGFTDYKELEMQWHDGLEGNELLPDAITFTTLAGC